MKLIRNYMIANQLEPHILLITNQLIQSVSSAKVQKEYGSSRGGQRE